MKSNVVDNSSHLIDGLHEGSNSSLYLSVSASSQLARKLSRYAEDGKDTHSTKTMKINEDLVHVGEVFTPVLMIKL